MRTALISDVHGNLPALLAVEADMATSRVDRVANLGDLLSGPLWVSDTCDHLMARERTKGWITIAGNHERQVLDPVLAEQSASDRVVARALTAAQRKWLAQLPAEMRLEPDFLLVHGSPGNDLRPLLDTVDAAVPGHAIRPATSAEVRRRLGDALAGISDALIVCGHTHLPRALALDDGRLVVNPGSVGLPAYDDDHPHPYRVENGTPHARYAIVEKTRHGWQVEFRAIAYDHRQAAQEAQANGRPDWARALTTGRMNEPEPAP